MGHVPENDARSAFVACCRCYARMPRRRLRNAKRHPAPRPRTCRSSVTWPRGHGSCEEFQKQVATSDCHATIHLGPRLPNIIHKPHLLHLSGTSCGVTWSRTESRRGLKVRRYISARNSSSSSHWAACNNSFVLYPSSTICALPT